MMSGRRVTRTGSQDFERWDASRLHDACRLPQTDIAGDAHLQDLTAGLMAGYDVPNCLVSLT